MAKYTKGSKVQVNQDNDNEGYDDFRDRVLVVTSVATSTKDHPGYDDSVGQALYDLETLDGKEVNSSLYEYELEDA